MDETKVVYDRFTKMLTVGIDDKISLKLTKYDAAHLRDLLNHNLEYIKELESDQPAPPTKVKYKALVEIDLSSYMAVLCLDTDLKTLIEDYNPQYEFISRMVKEDEEDGNHYEDLDCGMAYEHGYDDGYFSGYHQRKNQTKPNWVKR